MADRRIAAGVLRGPAFDIVLDGRKLRAYEGESVAAAILAAGERILRVTRKREEPRSLFCGIGLCQECRMVIEGRPNVRACQTPVRPGMAVKTQHGLGEEDAA